MGIRRIVLLALCAVLAFGAPLASAASSAGEPCATASSSTGAAPCGCDLPAALSACAQACGFSFSCSPLALGAQGNALDAAAAAAAAEPPGAFVSHPGVPALHPPR